MSDLKLKCSCGRGFASKYDGLCCFCREKTVSRSVAKSVGVRCAGDGLSVDAMRVIRGEVSRKEVWL